MIMWVIVMVMMMIMVVVVLLKVGAFSNMTFGEQVLNYQQKEGASLHTLLSSSEAEIGAGAVEND